MRFGGPKISRGRISFGSRKEPRYTSDGYYDTKEWESLRKAVKRRDRWTCQGCGTRAKTIGQKRWMEAHHIKHRSKGGQTQWTTL